MHPRYITPVRIRIVNPRRRRRIAVGIVAVVVGAGLGWAMSAADASSSPVTCAGPEVRVEWDTFPDCDVVHGQTLTYVDVPVDGRELCEHYGGLFIAADRVCFDVDF